MIYSRYLNETDELSSKLRESQQNESRFEGEQATAYSINSSELGEASHFLGDNYGPVARQRVEKGVLGGMFPVQFSSDINTMNSYYGMRDTIQVAKGLYELRENLQGMDVQEIADQGLRGAGERYPFMEQIQASFGNHYIGDLTAYTGLAAQEANAEAGSEAYHNARQVAFGEPPTLKVAAHEAAHAVQGVTSDQLEEGMSKPGDKWEENADAVADAVEKGKSAENLLDNVASNPTSVPDAVQFTKSKDQKRVEALLTDKNFLVASNRGPVVKKDQLSLSAGGLATAMRGALDGGGTWISNSGKNPPIHQLFAKMEQYCHTVDQFSPDSQHFESLLNPLGLHNERVYRPGPNKKFLKDDVESKEPFDVSHFSMDKAVYGAFYENVVNGWLWPVFHNLLEFMVAAPEDWEKYQETNQAYAEALFAGFSDEKDNIAWIQDYQLLLAPGMLREKMLKDTDRIGFFLHIPFANPDAFIEQLGEERIVEIVQSLLQSDVVGLQMYDDVEHFIKLARKLSKPLAIDESKIRRNGQGDYSVPVGKRVVTVKAFPISMDCEAQHETGASRSVEQARAVVKQKFDGQVQSYPKKKGGVERRYDIADVDATKAAIDDPKSIWVGGIERADYTKGLHQRVDAIELYFNENIKGLSESGYKPIFVLTMAPSREDVPSYKKYVDTLFGKINHVNQSFQRELGYAPIVLTGPVFDPEKSDLFAAYDVFVITALADGMNLTPLEVISAKHFDEEHDHRPAVFLLSEGAGVGRRHEFAKHGYTLSRTMEPEMIKDQLKRGIDDVIASREDSKKMEELVEKNKSMQTFVQENDIMKWAADFLGELVVESEVAESEFPDPGLEVSDGFPDPGFNVGDEISMAPLAVSILMPSQWQQRSQWKRPNLAGLKYQKSRPQWNRPRAPGRLLRTMGVLRTLRKLIRK